VFKVFSLATMLDSGTVSANTPFICNGHYQRVTNLGERVVINDNNHAVHGEVRMREIIMYSCNTGTAYASERLGADSFHAGLRNFGFGSRVGTGSPGEIAGFFRPVNRWSARSKPTIAIGQEILVSAYQMVQAGTAVANNGVLVPPRIVSQIRSSDGKSERAFVSGVPRRIIKPETARALRSYMVDASSGMGWRANMGDMSVAVKTGTAQTIDPATGVYSEKDYVASCIAFLPAENPELILYMVIIRPQGDSYYGSNIAAPGIRQAAEALVDYLGIPRGRNPQIDHSGRLSIPPLSPPAVGATVPDFMGYSKRELVPLLKDYRIEMNGEGRVWRQAPAPGTPLRPDTVIILDFL
jgi:cell division protein FtsI (penicillin-binding protein 3)